MSYITYYVYEDRLEGFEWDTLELARENMVVGFYIPGCTSVVVEKGDDRLHATRDGKRVWMKKGGDGLFHIYKTAQVPPTGESWHGEPLGTRVDGTSHR